MMTPYLIPHLVDIAADREPQHDAIRFGDEALTYQELAERSNSLARMLRDQGVRRGDRVAIYMNKGLEPAIAIYGIMKAGGVYVPLNAGAPPSRLLELVRDCDVRHLVTQPKLAPKVSRLLEGESQLRFVVGLPENDFPKSVAGTSWEEVLQVGNEPIDVGTIGLDAAYIIYTSGSTGAPKGIVHEHRGALAFAHWARSAYGFQPNDRFANHAPLHFDMSTFDYFVSAASGAATIVIPESHMMLPASYSQLLQDHSVSVLFVVPFALVQLLMRGALEDRDLSQLRWVIFGGDTSSAKHIRELMLVLPHVRFSHMYGPAETNGCTYYNLPGPPEDDLAPIPIGRMCEGMQGLIVNGDQEVEPGEPGELAVRTPTMMRGYWQKPEITESVLMRRRKAGIEHVYYRTGDLVKMNPDKQLVFLGRNDRQIKIRGYRVEMDEIELTLTSLDSVEEAGVYSIEDESGSHRLCAAIIPRDNQTIETASITKHLRQRLPAYAVPETIELRSELPRTTSGKIDRRALREQAP